MFPNMQSTRLIFATLLWLEDRNARLQSAGWHPNTHFLLLRQDLHLHEKRFGLIHEAELLIFTLSLERNERDAFSCLELLVQETIVAVHGTRNLSQMSTT